MSNIHALPGNIIPGEPDEQVVALLRKYLELAEAGHLTGVGIAAVSNESMYKTEFYGVAGTLFSLGFAISILSHSYCKAELEDE